MAQSVLESKLAAVRLDVEVVVDSAGTHARPGFPPDEAAVEIAAEHSVQLGQHRSRAFVAEDFQRFDRILVMEYGHLDYVQYLAPAGGSGGGAAIGLLMECADGGRVEEVVDPYRRSKPHYLSAYKLIELAVSGLVLALQAELVD